MAEIIIMPKLGFNMNEGKLVKWYKKEGDVVAKGENLFSIETDKTNMDIEATGDGVVRKLFIEEGDTLPVTLPIAIVGTADENIEGVMSDALVQLGNEAPTGASEPAAQQTESASDAPSAGTVVSAKTEGGRIKITPRARRVAAENDLAIDGLDIVGTGFDGGICEKDIMEYLASNKLKVTPVAKAIADAEGLILEGIKGSGINGKIMKADVEAAINNKAKAAVSKEDAPETGEAKFSSDGKEILEEIPYAGVRKVIGDRLSESKFTAPHLYFTQKVNLDKLLELRKEVNAAQDHKTSVTDFITKATVKALVKFPEMNSSLIDGKTIVKYKTVNIGIAVASPTGLIVPNIKSSENMSVVELSKASAPLFKKAREGKLAMSEYTGGTFTISNLGMFGIENFTAIINPPEIGILAVSSTKDEPFVVSHADGSKTVEIKPMMNIQLTVDHRVIDGLLAAQFVTEIKNNLENPISLLV